MSEKEVVNNKISKTFCILPWIHVSTKTNGEMRLCCTTSASSAGKSNDKKFGGKLGVFRSDTGSPLNLASAGLLKSWNSDYMKTVRSQMLKGEIPSSCQKCFKEETSGVNSKRIWETAFWSRRVSIDELVANTKENGAVPEKIQYMDLRFGHLCNLKCTMCSPHDSSSWIKDWKIINPQIKDDRLRETMGWHNEGRVGGASYEWYKNPEVWSDLLSRIPHMQRLHIAGGEPLILKEHFELLEECIRQGYAKNITLRYNSNGTYIPEKVLTLWQKFKYVRFGFSLDSFGAMNSYIRYPSKWADIEKNLRALDNTPSNIEVTMACAVQALNMYYLPEFIQWKLSQDFKKINAYPHGAGLINFHFVYHPANLNVKMLPTPVKDAIHDKMEKFIVWLEERFAGNKEFLKNNYGVKRLRSMVKFMYSEDWSNRFCEFQEYIALLDKTRGTSLEETFPEFYEVLRPHMDKAYFSVRGDTEI